MTTVGRYRGNGGFACHNALDETGLTDTYGIHGLLGDVFMDFTHHWNETCESIPRTSWLLTMRDVDFAAGWLTLCVLERFAFRFVFCGKAICLTRSGSYVYELHEWRKRRDYAFPTELASGTPRTAIIPLSGHSHGIF